MRSTMMLYCGSLVAIITVAIICVIIMQSSYNETLQQQLDDSIELAVEMCRADRAKALTDTDGVDAEADLKFGGVQFQSGALAGESLSQLDKFKADFVKYLTAGLDYQFGVTSKAGVKNLDVNIYGANDKTGLLSVNVVATFVYPTGKTDRVSSYKTVILDKQLKSDLTP